MGNSPQLEDGYTRLANELFEAILRYGFTGRQLLVLLSVVRKTYGYGKKQDDMSAAQIGQLCRLPRPHVTEVLGQLLSANVITKTPGTFGMVIGVNKNYSTWICHDDCKKAKSGAARPTQAKDNHYTYKLTHRVTGEFYIGVRSCLCHPNQDRYMGSGNWLATVKAADLIKEILGTFESRQIAEINEAATIKAYCGNPLMRNTRLYVSTESVQVGIPLGVQNMYVNSTKSVHADSTESVHTKENLSKEIQKKASRPEILFDQWIEQARSSGEKPIPEDHAVFKYADKVELPIDFIRLCWLEFKNTFAGNKKKRYADWALAFSNYVRKNYFHLWFEKDNAWHLTTAGIQLQKEMRDLK